MGLDKIGVQMTNDNYSFINDLLLNTDDVVVMIKTLLKTKGTEKKISTYSKSILESYKGLY
jgi:hypothetical protein